MFADCAQARSLTLASSATYRPYTARRIGGALDPASAGPFLLRGFAMRRGWAVKSIIIIPELVQIFVFEGCS